MKNFKYFLLAAVMALPLTACRQQEQADFSALSEVLTDREYQYVGYIPTTFTGSGLIHGDLTSTYYYLDYETMSEIPLCPDPNCEHGAYYYKNQRSNDNCGAYYYDSAFCYNGRMYFIEYKWKKRGTVERDTFLCCADMDGQNRRTIATFEDYDHCFASCRYENILYLFLEYPIWGDSDRTINTVPMDIYLCAFDLSAETVLFEERLYEGFDTRGLNADFHGFDQEGYVYCRITSYTEFGGPITDEGNWRCKVENGSLKIENVPCYDEVGGDWRVNYEWQNKEFSTQYKDLTVRMTFEARWFIHENRLYFWDYQNPDLYYLDGETGTIYIAENCLEKKIVERYQTPCDVYGDWFIFCDDGYSKYSKRSMSEFDFHKYEGEYERTYS